MSYMAVEWCAIARLVSKASPRAVISSARRVSIHPPVAAGVYTRLWSGGSVPHRCAQAEACVLREPQRAGGGGVNARRGNERRREPPVHRNEDGQRRTDHRERAIQPPAPRDDV